MAQPITFTTDPDDNRTQASFPGGAVWNADYANTGEMKRVWGVDKNGSTLFDYTYGYRVVNADESLGPKTSRIHKVSEPAVNGMTPRTIYSYDNVNRLKKAETKDHPNVAFNKTFTYTYDANSNLRTSKSGAQAESTYDYNAVNQLTCKRIVGLFSLSLVVSRPFAAFFYPSLRIPRGPRCRMRRLNSRESPTSTASVDVIC